MSEPIHILSLGAGVQSSTMALMAAVGEITPMPVAAIFADTQGEPGSVYKWLDWLEKQLPFPVLRISKGSLEKRCLTTYVSKKNNKTTFESIPSYVLQKDGSIGLSPRQCTRDFKIDPITKEVNRIRRENAGRQAVLWIGITTDEISRVKDHRNSPRIINRHPFVELRFNRSNCINWCKRNGHPEPPRSACYYCGFRKDSEWARMRREEPKEFAKAVVFDYAYRASASDTLTGEVFLHKSCKPLDQVDFSTEEERGQINMFNNECSGHCGV